MENYHELVAGFHKLSTAERLQRVQQICELSEEDLSVLSSRELPPVHLAENFIENVVGYFPIPMGVATNFNIDGKDHIIPMAVEETSIVAACCATAKWVRTEGYIKTYSKGNLIIGQIQIPFVRDVERSRSILQNERNILIELANACVPGLVIRGGGVRDIAIRDVDRADGQGRMLVLHILCDPCEAMGANLINQVCEALKPKIEEFTGEKVGLCILSNLVDSKMAGAEVVIRNVNRGLGLGIQEASEFAKSDPYRAATHNKGTLNGIDPILIATGNDWRAVEAGIHAYAARSGSYQPITQWEMRGRDLVGSIECPLVVGTVGGVTRAHPVARVALKMLGHPNAEMLARICVAVGLVQNLGALRALSTVGIVKGHMGLHATNLAIAAGAEVHEIRAVREKLAEVLKIEKRISVSRAKQILEEIRFEGSRAGASV